MLASSISLIAGGSRVSDQWSAESQSRDIDYESIGHRGSLDRTLDHQLASYAQPLLLCTVIVLTGVSSVLVVVPGSLPLTLRLQRGLLRLRW